MLNSSQPLPLGRRRWQQRWPERRCDRWRRCRCCALRVLLLLLLCGWRGRCVGRHHCGQEAIGRAVVILLCQRSIEIQIAPILLALSQTILRREIRRSKLSENEPIVAIFPSICFATFTTFTTSTLYSSILHNCRPQPSSPSWGSVMTDSPLTTHENVAQLMKASKKRRQMQRKHERGNDEQPRESDEEQKKKKENKRKKGIHDTLVAGLRVPVYR